MSSMIGRKSVLCTSTLPAIWHMAPAGGGEVEDVDSLFIILDCDAQDSAFLAGLGVMDYSLLVGMDDDSGELVGAFIDYLRQVRLPLSFSFPPLFFSTMALSAMHAIFSNKPRASPTTRRAPAAVHVGQAAGDVGEGLVRHHDHRRPRGRGGRQRRSRGPRGGRPDRHLAAAVQAALPQGAGELLRARALTPSIALFSQTRGLASVLLTLLTNRFRD